MNTHIDVITNICTELYIHVYARHAAITYILPVMSLH